MANTSKHISIRIPADVYAGLEWEAKKLDRSISWVVNARLDGTLGPPMDNRPVRIIEKHIFNSPLAPIGPERVKHSEICKCLICKPPKG